MYYDNIPFKKSLNSTKTGVVYHEDMLKHKWSNDYEKQMEVDECP